MQTSNLLIPIFSLSIANSVMRFGIDDEEDNQSVFTTGLATIGAGFLALLFLSPLLTLITDVGDYTIVIVAYVLASCLHALCAQFTRSQHRVKLFAFDGILCTLLTIGFNILFLVVCKMHITGYLLSVVLADICCALFLFITQKLYNDINISKLKKPIIKSMLRYSIPLIPTTVLWWVTNFADRFMVKFMISDFENGLYDIAYKIPTILVLVSMVFADAWQMSAVTEKDERPTFFGQVFYSFQAIVFIGGSGLIMLTRVCYHLLTFANPQYLEGWRYMPILIIATAFNCLVTFQSTVYIVEKRSVHSMWTSCAGAVLNIILNAILIPAWGVNGAAFATFASYFVIFWLRYFNTRRFIPFNSHLLRVCINTAVLALQCIVMLGEWNHYIIWEIALCLFVIVYNFKPLIISLKRLLKKDSPKVKES